MSRIIVLAALAVLSASHAVAQTCGSVQTTDSGLDKASLWPNSACPGWQDGGGRCEAATVSTYGGRGTNPVAEIDGQPRILVQDVTLRSGHTYVLSLVASRRTNCGKTPNPASASITFTNTSLGTSTVTRSNTTFGLTAESTTLKASSTSGRLTIGPGSSFGKQTCGLVVDDIELRHQAEKTAAFTFRMKAIVGSRHSLTVGKLTYNGDSYEIQYGISRAGGTPSYKCTHTATPKRGSISFTSCQKAAYGDTVEITAINNQGTGCGYPSTALPILRGVVSRPSESKLAGAPGYPGQEQSN